MGTTVKETARYLFLKGFQMTDFYLNYQEGLENLEQMH